MDTEDRRLKNLVGRLVLSNNCWEGGLVDNNIAIISTGTQKLILISKGTLDDYELHIHNTNTLTQTGSVVRKLTNKRVEIAIRHALSK